MVGQDENGTRDPLPEGVPEPPDPGRVEDLRERMAEDQAERTGRPRIDLGGRKGKQARDIGTFTIIPMMMIAGPLVGYLMGKGWENLFGGEPWPGVVGLLVGMVAAFRQVFLLLARRGRRRPKN
jgi:F0F1-type ATP synthase assembly protein I